MNTDTLIALGINGILQGVFFAMGFYFMSRYLAKSLKQEIPNWIVHINKAIRENHAIERATRRVYS